MAELNSLVAEQLFLILGVIAFLILLLLIIVIVQGAKLRKMRKRYELMMSGSGVEDLESLLLDLKLQMDSLEDGEKQRTARFAAIEAKLRTVQAYTGIKRYNAFSEHGSDLSFSVALLNDNMDGFVLTGLHNRESSYVYAKPIAAGQSTYNLSPEEQEAISLARSSAKS
ncbi:DUF4446 family protein [Paenibacillus hunanensis]|uniref:Regulator of protease activity HflC (Stomatin/prohibitin superfamily) n=1 Tax=Paenibacillus hunanensis TaxID=539262 RepID=A0ABU1J578_9BACL|nr:DUF4446 family protein [Paenibacillus hunanensis]MCL9663315.1 DUF4446 family protein [Paenibacillus hunanensis]MDR6246376.1 regulator of protease activity HflC (stomatin/prohibitin superfamily) [Paenibacillus hunanensis]WPP41397.1 DUF4446 family protein [Paenibacillus hunanensis]GGJ31096.1 hypothetical protein GCM10008022_44750 [Paenibacillus hunanensis]